MPFFRFRHRMIRGAMFPQKQGGCRQRWHCAKFFAVSMGSRVTHDSRHNHIQPAAIAAHKQIPKKQQTSRTAIMHSHYRKCWEVCFFVYAAIESFIKPKRYLISSKNVLHISASNSKNPDCSRVYPVSSFVMG